MEKLIKRIMKLLLLGIVAWVSIIFLTCTTYNRMNSHINVKNSLVVYYTQDNQKNIVTTYDEYFVSIDNLKKRYDANETAKYMICMGEGYKDLFISSNVSKEEKWKKMKLEEIDDGKYFFDFIRSDSEDDVITYRIEVTDSRGIVKELFFSYK